MLSPWAWECSLAAGFAWKGAELLHEAGAEPPHTAATGQQEQSFGAGEAASTPGPGEGGN